MVRNFLPNDPMTSLPFFPLWLLAGVSLAFAGAPHAASLPSAVSTFVENRCFDCHDSATRKGRLDVEGLSFDLRDPKTLAIWTKILDAVNSGDMPPRKKSRPAAEEIAAFVGDLTPRLAEASQQAGMADHVTLRRMNRHEYENTLRDLFGLPWIEVKEFLPEDGEFQHFNKSAAALEMSHVQLARFLDAAEHALREVIATQAARVPSSTRRFYTREQSSFAIRMKIENFSRDPERRTFPLLDQGSDQEVLAQLVPLAAGAENSERREREALGVVSSTYEPLEVQFDQFRAPKSGRYRLRLMAQSFWAGLQDNARHLLPAPDKIAPGRTIEPVVLYALRPPREVRRVASLDIGPTPAVTEVEVTLTRGESIRPDAVRLFRSRPSGTTRWRNPLATPEGMPGVAYRWLEVEGPLPEPCEGQGYALLFGDLPLKKTADGSHEVVPRDPREDGRRLLRSFVERTLRRPPSPEALAEFEPLLEKAHTQSPNFTESMIATYSAVLCSPAFLMVRDPQPGDGLALADRLSFFLWNSAPDESLRTLACEGKLSGLLLAAEVDRLINDPRSDRFVHAFADYWLDLRKIQNAAPDASLYPDYYLDDHLAESAVDESRLYLRELLRENLPARRLIESDFSFLNERLALHYGIPDVRGVAMRRVTLPADSPRGGFATQAAILKVTANGTTTSPVIRGVWINERLLGRKIPPPPAAVPAVEPDTRGASTIRELLAKHRSDASCNACHEKIDPPGFALENFDVLGGWRDRYRAVGVAEVIKGWGKNGHTFAFGHGPSVDASGNLPDGRAFAGVHEFKRLLLQDERQIARNLATQLIHYATGAAVRIHQRPALEALLNDAEPDGYGVRSIVQALVRSPLFAPQPNPKD